MLFRLRRGGALRGNAMEVSAKKQQQERFKIKDIHNEMPRDKLKFLKTSEPKDIYRKKVLKSIFFLLNWQNFSLFI